MHPISRRKLISAAMATAPLGAASGQLGRESRAGRKLKIIVCGGHPGDPEYGCGGTIARYTELGHDVELLYLNRGEKACPETSPNAGSDVRVPEAQKACGILKARAVFAAQCDGHAIVDNAHYDEFRKLLEAE